MMRPRRHPLHAVALIIVGLALVVAACSEETRDQVRDAVGDSEIGGGAGDGSEDGGGDGSGGDDEVAAPEQPAPEEPAPEEPSPPVADDTVDDGLSSEDWLLIAIIGAVAFVIILIAGSASSRRSGAKQAARTSLNARLGELVGIGQWVHDQGSIDVLRVNDPVQLQAVWATVRGRMIDLEGRTAILAADVADPQLRQSTAQLGQAVAALRGALESNVALRLDRQPGQEHLLQSSTQAVHDRLQELRFAIGPVSAGRR